jgi:hypothetical protein
VRCVRCVDDWGTAFSGGDARCSACGACALVSRTDALRPVVCPTRQVMEMLSLAHSDTFGHPTPTTVR